jgi:ATP-dependent DNA ligase
MLYGLRRVRGFPLSMRKVALAQLLSDPGRRHLFSPSTSRSISAIFYTASPCSVGLEGTVSKRLDRTYGTGKCRHWVKVIKTPSTGIQQGEGRAFSYSVLSISQ